ncbi:MAG TPA: hypothetical protein VFO37_04240 [Chitinophagaceae bacterium]|jgi:hypothetical protein|nr:hypothetical protein [Chitinophagaceae bacterium]
MKKILLMSVVLIAFTSLAGAASPVIPATVISEFRKQFGADVTVRWEKIDETERKRNLYVGHFIHNGIWSDAFFDESGEFVGIGKNITADQLPAKLFGLQQRKFKEFDVIEVYEYYLKNAKTPVYGLTIRNKHKAIFLKIDESGLLTVVKKEKFKN